MDLGNNRKRIALEGKSVCLGKSELERCSRKVGALKGLSEGKTV